MGEYICTNKPRDLQRITGAIAHVASLADSGSVVVNIKPYKASRSSAQNRLYWRWIGQIAKATGETKRGTAMVYQAELLEPTIVECRGMSFEVVRSTKDLSVDEFSEFLQQFQAMAAAEGHALESLDDLLNMAMGRK